MSLVCGIFKNKLKHFIELMDREQIGDLQESDKGQGRFEGGQNGQRWSKDTDFLL